MTMIRYASSSPRRASGFSLVEIMVGITIGLIGIVVILQVFAVSEGNKRTTTGGGDAQQSGAAALFSIGRDIRMAGYGFNDTTLLGCTVHAYDEGVSPARDFDVSLVPVSITQGASGAPDTITVTYGNSDLSSVPANLTQANAGTNANYKVDNRYGFIEGNLIIVADSSSTDCTLAQVTGVPGTPGQSDNIIHNSGNYTDANGATQAARYNKPSGLGYAYNAYDPTTRTGGRVYNLGALPASIVYSVQNGQLLMQDQMTSATSTPIMDGIVQMQALYGKDTSGDGNVDVWEETNPATPAAWQQVVAVRLAVVARSSQPEKPNPTSGACDTTTLASANMPRWNNGTTIDVSSNASWQCYRYKTFETVAPIRNMIWRFQ